MFYVEKYDNNSVFVRDTTDNILERFEEDVLLGIIKKYRVKVEGVSFPDISEVRCLQLKNKDKVVGEFCIDNEDKCSKFYKEEESLLPLDFKDIDSWIASRKIFACARNIDTFFKELGVVTKFDFINTFHCISLHDTFWIDVYSASYNWSKVSPYSNSYSELISRYSLDGIISGKDFNYLSPDLASQGSFPSTWRFKSENNIDYIKGSSRYTLGGSNSGNEPHSEYFACKIASYLGFDCVNYNIRSYTRGDGKKDIVTVCKSFTSSSIGSVTADMLSLKSYRGVLDYCIKFLDAKSVDTFLNMLFLDCLLLNTDRHFSNIEFLFDTENLKILRIAPIFDNNLALLPRFLVGIDTFIREDYTTRTGENFEDIFKMIMKYKNFKNILISLKNFKLINSKSCPVSEERLEFLNDLLRLQVDYYLSLI